MIVKMAGTGDFLNVKCAMDVVRCLMYLFQRPNDQLLKVMIMPNYWLIWPFDQGNKYIRHRTAAIAHLTSRQYQLSHGY